MLVSNNFNLLDESIKVIPHLEGKCLITRENRRPHKVWLSYKLFGQGCTKIFLVPSSELDENDLVNIIKFFASSLNYQICVYHSIYDSLNTLSTNVDQGRIHSLALDYFGLLDFLGWSRGIHLLGVSNGCSIVDRMSMMDPLRFTSVSLVNHLPNVYNVEACKYSRFNQSVSQIKGWSQKLNPSLWSKQSNRPNSKRNSKFIKLLHSNSELEDPNSSQFWIQSEMNQTMDLNGIYLDGIPRRRLKIFPHADGLDQCLKLDSNFCEVGYSDQYILLEGCDDLKVMERPDSLNCLLKAQFEGKPLSEYLPVPLIGTGPTRWILPYKDSYKKDETFPLKANKDLSHKRSQSTSFLRKRLSMWNILPSRYTIKSIEKTKVY